MVLLGQRLSSLPVTAKNHGASGTQTDGLLIVGHLGGSTSGLTFGYDGTNWSTRPSMASARRQGASFVTGTASASTILEDLLITQGELITEDFTGETTTANVKRFYNKLIMTTYRKIHGEQLSQ